MPDRDRNDSNLDEEIRGVAEEGDEDFEDTDDLDEEDEGEEEDEEGGI